MPSVRRTSGNPDQSACGAQGPLGLSPEAWEAQVCGCPSLWAWPSKRVESGERLTLSAHLRLTVGPSLSEHSEASTQDI